MYFIGQGKLFIFQRQADGSPGKGRFVGNVPSLEVNPESENVEHRESQTGLRLQDGRVIIGNTVNGSFQFEDFSLDNLAEALYGTKVSETADAVTAEAFPPDLVAGDFVRLKFPGVSNVVIEDDAGAPVVLTEGTHYRIASPEHGTIEILDPAAFTQPFNADYDYGAHGSVTMFSTPPKERWLRFEGLNTADESKPVLIEIYRARLDPTSLLALIGDEFANLPIAFGGLYDESKENDAQLGQFGRFVHIG